MSANENLVVFCTQTHFVCYRQDPDAESTMEMHILVSNPPFASGISSVGNPQVTQKGKTIQFRLQMSPVKGVRRTITVQQNSAHTGKSMQEDLGNCGKFCGQTYRDTTVQA